MKTFNKKLNSRPATYTSSGVWRKMIWPRVWGQLEKQSFRQEEIKQVFILSFAVLNDQNRKEMDRLIGEADLRRLAAMMHHLPVDMDEVDYDLLQVLYIETADKKFIGLNEETGMEKMELKKLWEVPELDISLFLGRQLVYPV